MIFNNVIIIGSGYMANKVLDLLLSIRNKELYMFELKCLSYKETNFSSFGLICKKYDIYYYNFIDEKELDNYFINEIINSNNTLIISANNLYLFKKELIEKKNCKIINFHDSIIPKNRGMNAVMWSIYNDEKKTGITWHEVDSSIDGGKIIEQEEITIEENDTFLLLTNKLQTLGITVFSDKIYDILNWNIKYKNSITNINSIHKKNEFPNNLYIDHNWNFNELYRFLRSCDSGILNLIPKCKIIIDDKLYEIFGYSTKKIKDSDKYVIYELNDIFLKLKPCISI